jgi:transposase-like protein
MSAPASPAPNCPLCGTSRTVRLGLSDLLQSSRVVYYRCEDCAFVWVVDLNTGESHAVTVRPETEK